MFFVRISNRFIVLITLVLSTSYIFGIDYYDKKESKISDLYQSVTLPEVTYTDIKIAFSGIKEQEILDERALAVRQSQSIYMLAHDYNCSKLCTQIHPNHTESEFILGDQALGVLITGTGKETPYSVSIKTQKDIDYNTYYKIKIQGIQNINQLDHLRSYSLRLFDKWQVKPVESLSFTGIIDGKADDNQRKLYVKRLLNKLKAHQTDYYQDDYNKDTQAYYAYTKSVKHYIRSKAGKKSNTQISFTYNEYADKTQIIIAFPFYNEPF